MVVLGGVDRHRHRRLGDLAHVTGPETWVRKNISNAIKLELSPWEKQSPGKQAFDLYMKVERI